MSLEHEEQMIDRLASVPDLSPEEKQLREIIAEKELKLNQQSHQYMQSLFDKQSLTPVSIKNVQVTNSQSFRDSFLRQQLQPLLDQKLITLDEFIHKIDSAYGNFAKLGVFENLVVSVQPLPKNYWTRTSPATEIVPIFNAVPVKRFYAKTGTNIGNGEGDGYIQFQLKNLFGGGELLTVDALTGTKTHSSYLLNYTLPVANRAYLMLESTAYVNSRAHEWMQGDVRARGASHRLYTQLTGPVNHELLVDSAWRSLANLGLKSLHAITSLGHDIKSSVTYNVRYDSRDNKHLPRSGQFLRFGVEYAGLFLFNASRYLKLVYETQSTCSLTKNNWMVFSSKGGIIFPRGNCSILDKFHIGGPTDVRAFTINGLGPKSYNSSIGGDYFLNGGLSLISNAPRYPDSNFKFHNFVNFGKLLPLNTTKSVKETAKDILTNHSVSCGFGVLYNHPMARFELNFVLPLAVHERDYTRKGLQYGIGIAFL